MCILNQRYVYTSLFQSQSQQPKHIPPHPNLISNTIGDQSIIHQFSSSRYSLICALVKIWNFLFSRTTPTSMLLLLISPSKPSFKVSNAVWIASSISISALQRFSRKIFAFLEFLPMAVAFQLQQAPEGSIWVRCGPCSSYPATSTDTPKGRYPPAWVFSCTSSDVSRQRVGTPTGSQYLTKQFCTNLRDFWASNLKSGPRPAQTAPMCSQMIWVLQQEASSINDDDNFFSVAITTPFLAFIPREVSPLATAARAFQIWGSLPLDANVVSEKSAMFQKLFKQATMHNLQIVIYMFDQLLEQFQIALAEAKQTRAPPRTSQSDSARTDGPFVDPTKTFAPVVSFGKSQRFKDLPQQQLNNSHIQWKKQSQTPVNEVKVFTFVKGERFEAEKPKYNETYINPDFNVVKKNITKNVPIYKKPIGKDLSKSNVSVSTVASESFRGPGIYNIKEQSTAKNAVFSKDNRFKKQKAKYQDTPLSISENQTRKRPPSSTVMKPKTAKTKHLISIRQQQQLRQKLKMIYWKHIPLQLDRLFKNSTGPVFKLDYFNISKMTGTQRRAALFMMMDRMNYFRGGYEQDISKDLTKAACAAVYRKSTPKPFKFSEMDPGPDYYYPTDDYVKPDTPVFSFGREGVKQKRPTYDDRDYEINEQIFKKGGNIIINPPHQEFRLNQEQIANLQRGPGFYDCIFKQVEKRTDIGLVKYQQITQKNDRENNCVQIKQVNDGIYFPSYSAIDPNIPAPLYKDPANIQPAHIPEKLLFPEHWLFYDGNLNKVRAQIAKNVILAKNMDFKQYKQYKQKFNRFKQYLQIQRRVPEVGQYIVKFNAIDPHIPNVQFVKQQQKTLLDPITKPQQPNQGDILILNPKKFEDHLPNIDFKKFQGRQQLTDGIDQQAKPGDVLVLNPTKPKKHIANVNFQKQQSRPQYPSIGDEEAGPQGDILIINPKLIEPHIPQIDFSKYKPRQQFVAEEDQAKQMNVLNPIKQAPAVKGVPFSRMSSVRMVPLLRQKSKIQQQQQ